MRALRLKDKTDVGIGAQVRKPVGREFVARISGDLFGETVMLDHTCTTPPPAVFETLFTISGIYGKAGGNINIEQGEEVFDKEQVQLRDVPPSESGDGGQQACRCCTSWQLFRPE